MATNAHAAELHPEAARLAALARWNDDVRLVPLFTALRELNEIGARLERLAGEYPATGAREIASDIGMLHSRYRETGRNNVYEWHTEPNGGAVTTLWNLFEERRRGWIDAKLMAEGLRNDLGEELAARYHDRYEELSLEAPTVEEARVEANRLAPPPMPGALVEVTRTNTGVWA